MMSHLQDDLIHELLDGEIPSSQLAPIQHHLAACAECRAALEQARRVVAESDDLIEALDDTPAGQNAPTVLPFRPRRTTWVRNLAWAASLLIAVSAGYTARGGFLSPDSAPTDALATPSESRDAGMPIAASDTLSRRSASEESAARPTAQRPAPANPVAAPPQAIDEPAAQPPALAAGIAERDVARQDADVANVAGERERREGAGPPAAGRPAPAPGRAFDAAESAARVNRLTTTGQLVPRDQMAAAKALAVPDTISLPDAMRLLGGSLRLIEGLVPLRLESLGTEVRVVYPLATGELLLSQRRVAEFVTWSLVAPQGFPADSLAVLRSKVRE